MTKSYSEFKIPPQDIKLQEGFIDLWYAKLDQSDSLIQKLITSLSDDEFSRAEEYRFDRDKNRFIVGRGILRNIIGRYLNIKPGLVNFRYGKYGKPYLSNNHHEREIKFNLAHSKDVAVYAFALGKEMGVDVECIREMPDVDHIASSFFSPREVIALRSIPENQKLEAFFNCWTRKEAYIKALGDGLTHPLDQFSVSFLPGEEPEVLEISNSMKPGKWSLKSFSIRDNYIAAVAVENCDYDMRLWKWGE